MEPRNTEPGSEDLTSTLREGVLTLTMNRPEARNALSIAMLHRLAGELADAETNPDVRCIVLTGAGKAFCAGGDVKNMAGDGAADTQIAVQIHDQRLVQQATAGRLHKMPKPTIASINGAAAGAGLSLALACDLRVMSNSAFMTTAFAKVGLAGDFGGAYFMTQLIGPAKAREFYLLSERIDAQQALRLGLTNWSVDAEELEGFTAQLAARLANGPSIAFRYMKENLNRAVSTGLDDCMDLEATLHIHSSLSEDHKEAATAFVAKRQPVFTGR